MLGIEHSKENFEKGLPESEKQRLKIQVPIWVLLLMSLYSYIYAAQPEWLAETVAGFVIFAVFMLMNYFFGYYALVLPPILSTQLGNIL